MLGEKIYSYRKQMGLSQKELAAMLNVTNKAISKWETNASLPKAELIIKLAEIFGVSADELLDLTVKTKEEKTHKITTLEELTRKTNELLQRENAKQAKDKPVYEFSVGNAKFYIFSVAIVFIAFTFLLTSAILLSLQTMDSQFTAFPWLLLIFFGAYVFSGFYTSTFCFILYYKHFPTALKITSLLLLFVTIAILFYGGIIILIPTVIKSIKVIRNSKKGDLYGQH